MGVNLDFLLSLLQRLPLLWFDVINISCLVVITETELSRSVTAIINVRCFQRLLSSRCAAVKVCRRSGVLSSKYVVVQASYCQSVLSFRCVVIKNILLSRHAAVKVCRRSGVLSSKYVVVQASYCQSVLSFRCVVIKNILLSRHAADKVCRRSGVLSSKYVIV